MTYAETLKAFLERKENTQTVMADAIGKTQVAVHRYAAGDRFPDAETARSIDAHTDGEVPFSLWQCEFLSRAGIDTPPQASAA